MKKVVLNGCFGGFGLSTLALVEILKRKGKTPYVFEEVGHKKYVLRDINDVYNGNVNGYGTFVYDNPEQNPNGYYWSYSFDRDDVDLIAVVEELGEKANCSCADLYIEEYDDENYIYSIDEYDGNESLELIPVVSEKRLEKCKSTKEIVDYLKSLGINVKTQ